MAEAQPLPPEQLQALMQAAHQVAQQAAQQHIAQQAAQQQNQQGLRGVKVPKPPTTNGRGKGTIKTPRDWLRQFKNYLLAEGVNVNAEEPRLWPIFKSYLTDGAAVWADTYEQGVVQGAQPALLTFDAIHAAFLAAFETMDPARQARDRLDGLSQRTSVAEYNTIFNELMLGLSDMHAGDRLHAYIKGLKPTVRVQVELARPTTLQDAQDLATRVDTTLYRDRGRNNRGYNGFRRHNTGSNHNTGPSPMELGNIETANLSSMGQEGGNPYGRKCWTCGSTDHLKADCPTKPKTEGKRRWTKKFKPESKN